MTDLEIAQLRLEVSIARVNLTRAERTAAAYSLRLKLAEAKLKDALRAKLADALRETSEVSR